MLKYLLDTNIVLYVIERRPLKVLDAFNANHDLMVISDITMSELIYGAEKSASVEKNLRVVEEFVSHLDVFPNLALENW